MLALPTPLSHHLAPVQQIPRGAGDHACNAGSTAGTTSPKPPRFPVTFPGSWRLHLPTSRPEHPGPEAPAAPSRLQD